MCEIEETWLWILNSRKKYLFPRYFHVLAPKYDDKQKKHALPQEKVGSGSPEPWEGRVRTI